VTDPGIFGLFKTALGVIGSVAGAALGLPPVKEFLAGCKTRALAGRVVPGNHDLVRGVRTAQLCALDGVLRRHGAMLDDLLAGEIGDDERPFAASVRAFVEQRLKVADAAAVDHAAIGIEDIDHVLGQLTHPSTAEGYAEVALVARREVAARARDEIATAAGRAPPPLFARAFDGEPGHPGWYDLFALFVGEELKTNERFRAIFLAAELVDLRRGVAELVATSGRDPAAQAFMGEVRGALSAIQAGVDDLRRGQADQAAVLAGQTAMIEELLRRTAADKGVAEAPLRAVLAKLGDAHVTLADIPTRLAKAADELLALRAELGRLRNDRPEFAAIRDHAMQAIDLGDFDAARAHLRRGREIARDMRLEHARTEASFLAEEARVARLALDHDDARAKLTEATALTPENCWLWIALGDLHRDIGSTAAAAKAFGQALKAAEGGDVQRDLGAASNRLGDVLVAQGRLDAALERFEASMAIHGALSSADPGNTVSRRDLSVSLERVGNVLVAQGRLDAALERFEASMAIFEALSSADPSNTVWRRDLSVSLRRVGDVLVAQGQMDAALERFEASMAIREALSSADPGNTVWRRDLSVSLIKVGDVLVAQGRLDAALKRFEAAMAIREALAAADSGNAAWRRDLSVSLDRVGDMLVAQGRLDAALERFEASLEIAKALSSADPGNAVWRRDLSVSLERVGDVLVAQGRLDAALERFEAAMAIREALSSADPSNTVWRRDVAVSLSKIANVHLSQGDAARACPELERGRAIMAELVALAPGAARWRRDLDWFDETIRAGCGAD
jgi:tetratricopeptide (TPR) repeat protein